MLLAASTENIRNSDWPQLPFVAFTREFEQGLDVMDSPTEISTIKELIALLNTFQKDQRNKALELQIAQFGEAFHDYASEKGKQMLYQIVGFMSSLNSSLEA